MSILTDRAVEKIHEAVQEAVSADMSVSDFIRNAWVSWEQELEDQKRMIASQFKKALGI